MSEPRAGGLLAWQWTQYPGFHGDRRNLVIHLVTVPLFQFGAWLLTAPLWGPWWVALAGLGLMGAAVGAQGRGHAMEKNAPIPFASRSEAVGRILLEQWINFPRFVVSGGVGRAWRGE